jgi:phosphoribosylamine---glycine ligase
MRILFVSKDLLGGDVATSLQKEGHEVKLYIDDPDRRDNLEGFISNKVTDWRTELSWVGKTGLIIFDDIGFGEEQDELRKEGYIVFGGSRIGEKLEKNRYYGQEIFRQHGINTVPLLDFTNIDHAIEFLKEHRGMWVIKQNGPEKEFNYVGCLEDAGDTISVLENYKTTSKYEHEIISLHQRIFGVEIGVARYFNGNDWVGPIEISFENKRLFPGDIGPTTFEMGTLAWYDDDENNKLFQETLAKLKPFLKEVDFRGDFSVNCIVNENGAFPTEATARFGCPIVHLQSEIHDSPWGEFLYAVAKGEPYDLKWKKGYGLVATIAAPPFPFHFKDHPVSSRGVLMVLGPIAERDINHLHFEEISKTIRDEEDIYTITDNRGYILYVTAMGASVQEAQKLLYQRIGDIHIPKMMYRNDIGKRFIERDLKKLKEWEYISENSKTSVQPALRNIVHRVFHPSFK